MSLVFLAILLLWLGMVLIVRLTGGNAGMPEKSPEQPPSAADFSEEKEIAAAVAVAYALAQREQNQVNVLPLPTTVIVSAWQAVTRSNNLSTRKRTR